MADDPEYLSKTQDNELSPDRSDEKTQGEEEFPEGGARAWGVALGCGGILFCTFGFANSFGVFQEYYQKHQLASSTPDAIAWIGSLQVFFLLGGNCFGGPLFDRYGAKIIWPSAAVYIFSIFITSACKELYQFILAQGILAGIAMGMTMAPGMASTGQWFNKKRGAAMGVAVAGSSLGGVIFPIALNKMLNNPNLSFGWTVRICGFLIAAIMVPSSLAIRARLPPRRNRFFLLNAFKEPQYLALILAVFLSILGVFVPIFYLPSYAVSKGMGTEMAFYLTAILNAASFFDRVIPGITADKVGRLNMLFVMAVCTGILAFCWQLTNDNASIIAFSAIYGFFSGAIVSLMTVCFAQIPKSPKDIGTYLGQGLLVVSTGALIGPPISGALVKQYHGSFSQVSYFCGAVTLAGGLSVPLVKYTTKKGIFAKVWKKTVDGKHKDDGFPVLDSIITIPTTNMLFTYIAAVSFVGAVFAAPVTENAAHGLLEKRAVTPDATCGGTNKYTCQGSSFGNCCSANGWCGSTSAYCGTGCQTAYGTCTGATPPNPTPSTTLADCLGKANVPVKFASSSDFASLAQPYNLRLAYTPAVIVLPTTTKHVSDAVVCAAKSKVKVQAKGGGHSYASYSSGGQSGSMVIDLEGFQTVSLDTNTFVAKAGGGVRLGNLAVGIYNAGKRALPHGTCPGVGVGGHATHGGFGLSSRAWGLTLDTIVGLDVVLANGSFIHATSTAYPDIYYAMRGAGDSFGIVTTFYLKTQPAPATVINWSFSLPGMFTSPQTTTNAFLHLQSFALNASVVDRNLGLGLYFDGSGFSISGTYFGSLTTFNDKIKPELLRTLPTPSSSSVQAVDWIKSLTLLAGGTPLSQPLPRAQYTLHDDFFAKSLVVPTSSPLTAKALNSYFNYTITTGVNAPNPWFSIINLYGGPGSQINVPAVSSSAYSDRTALWVIQHYGFTGNTNSPYPPASISFINGLSQSLISQMPGTVFGGYLNYVDPSLSPSQAHTSYYDGATYQKLVGIKNVVDPGKVFWNPQAIGN